MLLVCFPHAGGSPSAFRGWAARLPGAIEVCGVTYPGRAARFRERPCHSVEAVARDALSTLATQLRGRFALFGHSFGALVAFEVARLLNEARGPAPEHLFVSGRNAPGMPRQRPPLHQLDDVALWDALKAYGGMSAGVQDNPELSALILPALRADLAACESYEFKGGPVHCPISALFGSDDEDTSREKVAGWAAATRGPFELIGVRGGHFFVFDQLEAVAAHISGKLCGPRPAQAQAP